MKSDKAHCCNTLLFHYYCDCHVCWCCDCLFLLFRHIYRHIFRFRSDLRLCSDHSLHSDLCPLRFRNLYLDPDSYHDSNSYPDDCYLVSPPHNWFRMNAGKAGGSHRDLGSSGCMGHGGQSLKEDKVEG